MAFPQSEICLWFQSVLSAHLHCCMILFADSEWHWQSIDDTVTEPLDVSKLRKAIIPKYDLCLTGEVSL